MDADNLLHEQLRFTAQYLDTMTASAIFWWCASVALCVALTGGALAFAGKIASLGPARIAVFWGVLIFMISVGLFGMFLALLAYRLGVQYREIAAELGVTAHAVQFDFFIFGLSVGASTFVIFIAIWLAVWQGVARLARV